MSNRGPALPLHRPRGFTCRRSNPSPALEAIARERGWRILHLFETSFE